MTTLAMFTLQTWQKIFMSDIFVIVYEAMIDIYNFLSTTYLMFPLS